MLHEGARTGSQIEQGRRLPPQADKIPSQYCPGISFPRNPVVWAAGAKGGGNAKPTPHQRKGRFPPQETAFYAESCRNISAKEWFGRQNALQPVM
jgi:hypothetical protein